MPKDGGFHFEGFSSPNGTIVPDDVFDVLAPELTEAELRVLLYIVRRTFGFKKSRDQISLTQMVEGIKTRDGRVLDRGTGMSRRGVMKGCAGLVEKGVITVERRRSELGDSDVNIYSLCFQEGDDGRKVGHDVPHPRARSAPPVGNQVPPQHVPSGKEPASTDRTVRQQTGRHDSKLRRQPGQVLGSGGPRDRGSGADRSTGDPPRSALPETEIIEGAAVNLSAAAPPIGANGHAAAPLPARRPLRARLAPEERRRYDQDRQRVVDYLSDFARELGDAAPLASSVTRAVNIQRAAGVPFEDTDWCYRPARAWSAGHGARRLARFGARRLSVWQSSSWARPSS